MTGQAEPNAGERRPRPDSQVEAPDAAGERVQESPATEGPTMEIHPPERPIHSVKDFLLHLTTITIGILIALSLEGVVQWSHHRTLAREAKARLAEEMAGNAREVKHFLDDLPTVMQSEDETLKVIDDVRAHKKIEGTVSLKTHYRIMSLTATSWTTAQTTGALGYMEYSDVQTYANVYDLQAKVVQLQDRLLENYIGGIKPPDPDTASERDLQEWKRDTLAAKQYLDALRQLGEPLLKGYDAAR